VWGMSGLGGRWSGGKVVWATSVINFAHIVMLHNTRVLILMYSFKGFDFI
jgi:hypothetical protein